MTHFAGDLDAATINLDADGDIFVKLDSNDDGLGGADHGVLMYGVAKTSINIGDQFSILLGTKYAGIMHWDISSADVYQIHAMISAGVGFDLDGLDDAVPDDTKYGKILKKLVAGFEGDAEVTFTTQVRALFPWQQIAVETFAVG